jgi:hypothetical protein
MSEMSEKNSILSEFRKPRSYSEDTTNSMQSEETEIIDKKQYILSEVYRPSTMTQDILRILILALHLYYLVIIFMTWGNSPKIILFLTLLCYYNCCIYYFIMLYNKYLHTNYDYVLIVQNKINTFYRLTFTASCCVVILFWAITLTDPKLMGDSSYSLDFEYFIHGGNFLFLLLDRVVVDREHRYENRVRWYHLMGISCSYFTVIYTYFHFTGFAVYPLLAILGFKELCILQISGTILFFVSNIIYKLLI